MFDNESLICFCSVGGAVGIEGPDRRRLDVDHYSSMRFRLLSTGLKLRMLNVIL